MEPSHPVKMQNRIPDANKRQPIPITRSPTAVLVTKIPTPTLMQAQAATINANATTPDTKIAKNGNKITTSKILNTPLAAVMINGERNTRAIAFYKRHGFRLTGQKKFEEGTTEYIVKLTR